jgi:flagellar hook-length control protein FliK
MSAPELTQSLSQSATLRGQEAQALMRSYTTSVDAPVGDNEWGEKVMGKLAWLTASQMSVAEIHITPPELGPLDVRVQVQNDQATVTVHATTPAVREQLELHGHRLRDMLSEQGLSLEGFDVSDSSSRETADQQGDGEGRSEPGPGQLADEGDDTDADTIAAGSLDLSWRGEVDLYA